VAHFAFWVIWATWTNNQRRERGSKMIEKITNQNQIARHKLAEKINELVDAVNELTSCVGQLGVEFIEPKPFEFTEPNIADPYAEQRNWLGCLCRFWFDNKKQADIGILGDIDEDEIHPYFNADLGHNYKYCEPVKPDDDIIYNGE
jgi:hypothetical protein